MYRPVALLAFSTLALSGCAPGVGASIPQPGSGSAETYANALALREDDVAAGVACPGTEQTSSPEDPGTTFLDCQHSTTAMAVTSSEDRHAQLLDTLGKNEYQGLLYAANWIIFSSNEALLPELQDELGGTITSNR